MAKELCPHKEEINVLLKDAMKVLNNTNVSVSKIHNNWYGLSAGNDHCFDVYCVSTEYGSNAFCGKGRATWRIALEPDRGSERINATYADEDLLNLFATTLLRKYNECKKRKETQALEKAQNKIRGIVQQKHQDVQKDLIDMCEKLFESKDIRVYEGGDDGGHTHFVVYDDVNKKKVLVLSVDAGNIILQRDYFQNSYNAILDGCQQKLKSQRIAKEKSKQQKLADERRKASILTLWHVKDSAKSILGENYKLVRKDADNPLIQICFDILNSSTNISVNETLRNLFSEFYVKGAEGKVIFRINYRMDKKVFGLSVWGGISYEHGYDVRKDAKKFAVFSSDEPGFEYLKKLYDLADKKYQYNVVVKEQNSQKTI